MITLRQLRYLQALARHRHFGRAAESCAVTQPALSMQIRELEKELGVELVDRRPGDAALTEIGVLVAKRGDEVLAAARDLVDLGRHRGRLLKGQLKLGVIPTIGPYVLPELLPLLHIRHPDLIVKVRETQTKALIEELVAGDLHAVVLRRRGTSRSFVCSTILFCLLCLPTIPSRRRRASRPAKSTKAA